MPIEKWNDPKRGRQQQTILEQGGQNPRQAGQSKPPGHGGGMKR